MDFLDPRKARAHHRRLVIGYISLSIAIALGTTLLVWAASGYSVDTKTGQIVENGLLFVDSHPNNARIELNGSYIGENTSARKVLPAGNYSLKISKDGYRDWSRNFTLQEHTVAHYVYPFLFPKSLNQKIIKQYAYQPSLVTVSPDRRWLVVSSDGGSTWDVYDTTKIANGNLTPETLVLPDGLLSASTSIATLKLVEWSTDNKNLLVKRSYSNGSEYLIINRDKPEESYNVNARYITTPQEVALRDKDVSELYVLGADKTLKIANFSNSTLGQPILKDVAVFKSYGADLVLYMTASAKQGFVQAKVLDKTKNYVIADVAVSDKYMVDLAKFQGHFYYAIGGNKASAVNLYKDPMNTLKDTNDGQARPFLAMRITGTEKIGFSANARFISAESGQNFAVYDLEEKQYYRYVVAIPIVAPALWMDGHRLITSSGGKTFVMDYDKTNQQILATTTLTEGAYFDRDYETMFTLSSNGSGGTDLMLCDLRAGEDLPN